MSTQPGPGPDDALESTPSADVADMVDAVDAVDTGVGADPEPAADAVPTEPAALERSWGSDPAYVDDSGELPLLVPARERFAGVDAVPVTGEPRVDAATARLEEIVALPTADHVEVYEDVHQRLQGALADADSH